MMILLATREVRRIPALLLVPCLLMMGVLVATSTVRDSDTDGMSAHQPAHAQLVRGTALRPAAPGGNAPVAVMVAAHTLPQQRIVRDTGERTAPVVALRSAPLPFHLSRAPPAIF
jgi:hypothetical protein